MLQEKLEQLVKILEKQELEDSIQDSKLYHELFAAYLYLDDLWVIAQVKSRKSTKTLINPQSQRQILMETHSRGCQER